MSRPEADAERAPLSQLLKHAFVTAAWIGCFVLLAQYGARALPIALARELSLHAYLSLVHVLTLAVGLGVCALLLADVRVQLGFSKQGFKPVAWALLLAPPVYIVSSYVAIGVALPTLVAELATRGRQAVQADSGEFGRQLVSSPVWMTLLWAVVLSPLSEELMFRGALWSLVQRVVDRVNRPAAPAAPASLEVPMTPGLAARMLGSLARGARQGGLATLVSAGVFASLHADMPGGMGIVRVVSALGLGLATGVARHAGGVVAAIVLHSAYNLLSLANTRRWVVSEAFPMKLGVPTLLTALASACLLVALVWWLRTRRRREGGS